MGINGFIKCKKNKIEASGQNSDTYIFFSIAQTD